MKRFFVFLGIFAVCVNSGYSFHPFAGAAVAGMGFAIAYCYGESS